MMMPNTLSASFNIGGHSPLRTKQTSTSQAQPLPSLRPGPGVDFKFHQHVTEELKRELEVRMILETKISSLEEKVKELNGIKIAYHNILVDNQKLTQMIDSYQGSSKNLETKIGMLISENDKLRGALESKALEYEKSKLSSSSNNSDLRKENDRLRAELRNLESLNEQLFNENSNLKRQNHDANESQMEKGALEDEIDGMRRELEDIQTMLTAQKEELDEYRELEEKSEMLVMENQKLHTLVEDLKQENSEISQNLFALSNRTKVEESMTHKFKEKAQETNSLKEEIHNLLTELELLKEENSQLNDALSSVRKASEVSGHQLLERKHEAEVWRSKAQTLEHKLRLFEAKEGDFQASISEFNGLLAANEELAIENQQLAGALAEIEANLDAMRANRANQEALIKDYMHETELLRKRVSEQQLLMTRFNPPPASEKNDGKVKELIQKIEEMEGKLQESAEFQAGLEEQIEFWKSKALSSSPEDKEEYINELETKIQQICEENEKIHELYLEACGKKEF